MANGMDIEGIGTVAWTFPTPDGSEISIHAQAYYVPKSKARLCSPQRLFDRTKGVPGKYEGDERTFRLLFDSGAQLTVDYDERTHLPTAFCTAGAAQHAPQINLTILDEENQNLTMGQKVLLHWHGRFGHLNFAILQKMFRAYPFDTAKFSVASKCNTQDL